MKIRYRVLLVVGTVAIVTGGMVAAWYGWQDYKGNQQWEETRRNLEARGEPLTFAPFIPPLVPDDQNLAFAPLFMRLYQYRVDPKTGVMTFNKEGIAHAAETKDALPFGKGSDPFPTRFGFQPWMTGHTENLAKYQKYFQTRQDFPHPPQPQTPAGDVRLALTRFGPSLDELAQAAAQRPLGRFPVNWTQQSVAEIALPHDVLIPKLVTALQLRATASLALGQFDDALGDTLLGFRTSRTLEAEPIIITSLVDIICLESLLQPVWEGLAAHGWSAGQVAQLQVQFGQVDLIRSYQRALRAERASVIIPLADDLERSRNMNQLRLAHTISGDDSGGSFYQWMSLVLPVLPEGWFAESKAVACRLDQQGMIDPVQPAIHRIFARASEEGATTVHRLPVLPSTFVATMLLSARTSTAVRVAQAQAFVDEAVVACALERYFLERHGYPGTLAELVPGWIERVPPDVIDGAPMRYLRTPEGSYRLWEVGWNGVDEGGKIVMVPGTTKPDVRQGDWVWQYAAVPGGVGARARARAWQYAAVPGGVGAGQSGK